MPVFYKKVVKQICFFFKYTLSSIKSVKLSECHLLEVQPLSKLVTEDTVWYGLYCCVSNDRGNSKTDQKKNNIVYMKSFPRGKKNPTKTHGKFCNSAVYRAVSKKDQLSKK